MERTTGSGFRKHLGRVGSLGFATLSIFMASPVFAAEGGNRDRQSSEWVKQQKVMRNLATENQAKKEAKKAEAAESKDSPRSPEERAKCSC
jgi:hypothetical protein